jgi:hypothetical protein
LDLLEFHRVAIERRNLSLSIASVCSEDGLIELVSYGVEGRDESIA